MSRIIQSSLVAVSFSCDKKSCDRAFVVGGPAQPLSGSASVFAPGVEGAEAAARDAGWSRWYGRSVFYYCPAHGPSAGATLDRIW